MASFYVVAFSIMFAYMLIFGRMLHQQTASLPDSASFLVVFPVIFVITWLFFYPIAALFCFLYNQVAKMTGGVEFSIL
jgi:hypothetical protein